MGPFSPRTLLKRMAGTTRLELATSAVAEMVSAVREVLRGKTYMSAALLRDSVNFLRRQDKKPVKEDERLTERRREVLQLLAEGRVMKEVGGILNMTPGTVAFHKYRMMKVLGIRNTAELIKYALTNHMVARLGEPWVYVTSDSSRYTNHPSRLGSSFLNASSKFILGRAFSSLKVVLGGLMTFE